LPYKKRILRIAEGGDTTHEIEFPDVKPVACCLGGKNMRTLFIVAADYTLERMARDDSSATIYTVDVDVPGFPLF
jgi:sugar lactone lactonase YvrE